jgi:NAD(P)-dependent dehydrogenase (short-subunit alcohol dehydrogenase family)
MQPTVLITGANRGLGLEFCRQYGAAGWQVIACCRHPEAAPELTALTDQHPSIEVRGLDVSRFAAIDELSLALRDRPIDVLINNAGVYGDAERQVLGHIDYAAWENVFRVNAEAPVRMVEAFLPQLAAGQRKLIVAISTLMGSIGDNTSGGHIQYRSSKAALNAAMKSLSLDLRGQGIGVLILHPGWVRTEMGGPQAPTLPAESIAGMRQVIESWRPEATGQFVNFRGEALPW